jgi:hypothetical protein
MSVDLEDEPLDEKHHENLDVIKKSSKEVTLAAYSHASNQRPEGWI